MPDTEKDIVLEITDVHKSFGDLEVLKEISLDVERGEVVVVIGPSGSGNAGMHRGKSLLSSDLPRTSRR